MPRYGYYRYGRHEYQPEDRPRRTPRDREAGPSPYERFGAGVALRAVGDDDGTGVPWDLVADATGDLAATAGYDELTKDIAFATATDASTIRGKRGTANERARVTRDIEDAAVENPHISEASARLRTGGRRPRRTDRSGGGRDENDRVADAETLGVDLAVATDDGESNTITIQIASSGVP